MNIDDAVKEMADALWNSMGPDIMKKVRCALIDRFARAVILSLDSEADDLLRKATAKMLDATMEDPIVEGMLRTCSRKAATKRVVKKLSALGVKTESLTEQEREWLAKHGYDIEGAKENDEANTAKA